MSHYDILRTQHHFCDILTKKKKKCVTQCKYKTFTPKYKPTRIENKCSNKHLCMKHYSHYLHKPRSRKTTNVYETRLQDIYNTIDQSPQKCHGQGWKCYSSSKQGPAQPAPQVPAPVLPLPQKVSWLQKSRKDGATVTNWKCYQA